MPLPNQMCSSCRRELPLFCYSKDSTKTRGVRTTCKSCIQVKDQQRRQELYVAVNALKDAPCTDCGNKYPAVCMDFDHVTDVKVKDIAGMIRNFWKLSLILKEIEKCELVCANCHRIRTHKREKPWGSPVNYSEWDVTYCASA